MLLMLFWCWAVVEDAAFDKKGVLIRKIAMQEVGVFNSVYFSLLSRHVFVIKHDYIP